MSKIIKIFSIIIIIGFGFIEINNNSELLKQSVIEFKNNIYVKKSNCNVDNFCIIYDPYSLNPLSAYIVFETDELIKYQYTVKGKDGATDFIYTNEQYQSGSIFVPVIMLYQGDNTVILEILNESGVVKTYNINIKIDFFDYQPIDIEYATDIQVLNNGYIVTNNYQIYDQNGDIRFSLTKELPSDEYLNNQTLKFEDDGVYILGKNNNQIFHATLIGEIKSIYTAPRKITFNHDVTVDNNGNVYAICGSLVSDSICKFNAKGRRVAVWNYAKVTENNLVDPYAYEEDLIHFNSIDYNGQDNTIIASSRSQSAIMGINADTGEIVWISSDGGTVNSSLNEKQLTPIGDNFTYTSGQHTAFINYDQQYSDYRDKGNIILTVYNNNISINCSGEVILVEKEKIGDISEVCFKENSEVVFYSINTKDKTIETINTIESNYYSPWIGGTYQYKDYYSVASTGLEEPMLELFDNEGNLLVSVSLGEAEYSDQFYRARFIEEEKLEKSLE